MKLSTEQLFDLLLNLLNKGSPYKHESLIYDLLPKGGEFDKFGNYWLSVSDSDTLFSCHLDTIGIHPFDVEPFYYEGKIYSMSNDSPCLGGDDRCGILVLSALINAGVPGTYLFHAGEEKGCLGAREISKSYDLSKFKKAIEFDRRGKNSIITTMCGYNKVCSDEFAAALATQIGLNFAPDDTGLMTDVLEYDTLIPEITNLSVGYSNEHTNKEVIDADWLIKEYIPALYKVKWEQLPIVRNPQLSFIEEEYDKSIEDEFNNFFFSLENKEVCDSCFEIKDCKQRFVYGDYITICDSCYENLIQEMLQRPNLIDQDGLSNLLNQ